MDRYRPLLMLIVGGVLETLGAGTLALFAFQGRFIPVFIGVVVAITGYYVSQAAEKARVHDDVEFQLFSFGSKGVMAERPRLQDLHHFRDVITPHFLYKAALGIVGVGLLTRGLILLTAGITQSSMTLGAYAGVTVMLGYFAAHRSVNNEWI